MHAAQTESCTTIFACLQSLPRRFIRRWDVRIVRTLVYARAQTQRRVLNVQPFFPLFLSSPTHFYGAHTQTHIRKQLQCQRLPTHQPITTAQPPYACRWYKQTTQNALPRSNQSEKSASVICYEQVLWRKLTGNVLSRQSEFTAGKLIVDIMKQ